MRGQNRANKKIEPRLQVHAWTPSGFILAGLLTLEEEGDRDMTAVFVYDPAYLKHPMAYPLDPINLPLSTSTFATTSQFEVLGAIFDAAPDAWGRKVAKACLPEDEQDNLIRKAFLRGYDGIGSIILTPENSRTNINAVIKQSLSARPTLSQLDQAAEAAKELDDTGDISDNNQDMLSGSWTIGGSRPKAILKNDSPGADEKSSVIAKFPYRRDTVDQAKLEYVSLEMAADMGFNVSGRKVIESKHDEDNSILILERFDREIIGHKTIRRHYVSAMSLTSYEPQSKLLNTRYDQAMLSWSKLLEITSRVAKEPAKARVEMYARLCLNAALGNTDDHLKNFGFLRCIDDPLHYELAPVFDISPQRGELHYLHCSDLGQRYTLTDVIAKAKQLGISSVAAKDIDYQIRRVLAQRFDYFDAIQMSSEDQEKADEWICRGLGEEVPGGAGDRPRE